MTPDPEDHGRRFLSRPFKESLMISLARAERALKSVRADQELIHISDPASIAILEESVERYRTILDSDRAKES